MKGPPIVTNPASPQPPIALAVMSKAYDLSGLAKPANSMEKHQISNPSPQSLNGAILWARCPTTTEAIENPIMKAEVSAPKAADVPQVVSLPSINESNAPEEMTESIMNDFSTNAISNETNTTEVPRLKRKTPQYVGYSWYLEG